MTMFVITVIMVFCMLSEQSTAKLEIGHVGAVAVHLAMVEPRRGPEESSNNQSMVVLLAHVWRNKSLAMISLVKVFSFHVVNEKLFISL